MAVYGKVEEFNAEHDSWTNYTERLTQYFLANDVQDVNKKRAILLSVVGAQTYELLRSLLSPEKPSEKSYDELVEILEKHCHPKPSPIVQRCKFYACERAHSQTVASFVANLRKFSEHCQFGASLQEMLRDRLVVGINDQTIQKRLLAVEYEKLTFTKAFEMATSIEQAISGVKDIQQNVHMPIQADVNKIHAKETPKARENWKKRKPCYRCGAQHSKDHCQFKESECYNCGKIGHISSVCKSKKREEQSSNKPGNVNQVTEEEEMEDEGYRMFSIGDHNSAYKIDICLDGNSVEMEIDTGAAVSIISKQTFEKFFKGRPLDEHQAKLRTYTGEPVPVLGSLTVKVQYHDQSACLPLFVVDGVGPNLLGRSWLKQLKLDWSEVHHVTMLPGVCSKFEAKYPGLWKSELGEIKGVEAKIHVNQKAVPRFFKPRQVAYSLREKVEEELQHLQQEGILEPVQFSEWAAPIVPVLKSNGKVRICGDYKITANRDIQTDQYPLPRIEDLYATLSGGQKFTKLDLSNAFLQIPLEEESRKYTTINTQRGLFQYTRLPFGISSSPSIFQRVIDNLTQGLKSTVGYQDDILVTGKDDEEHLENLEMVLKRLSDAGVRLNKDKCVYMAPEVIYLGYKIDAKGLHPVEDKVCAIIDAPSPTNVTELRSYLGLLNYYGRFLPNLSMELAPLHSLLKKDTKFVWNKIQQSAFERSKQLLKSSGFLVHFDPKKQIILACDASPKGIGAVISHIVDGVERPISCSSRTLSPAEKGYSQLEKEALAVVWGVKKFHSYLYGYHFTINNDHRPLETLFSAQKSLPTMASGRVQRWALTLSAYDYEFKYKPGTQMAHADALSRLPLTNMPRNVPLPAETTHLLNFLSSTPITAKVISTQTKSDVVLSKVLQFLTFGWPDGVEEELRPFASRKNELSLEQGCVLLGTRVVIPAQLKSQVLQMLHEGHTGIVKTKSFARRYVYWPGIDQDIEHVVKTCIDCQSTRPPPGPAPLHPWEFPKSPWSRIHVDYAGPLQGNKMILVMVDAHSKWIDAFVTGTSTSFATIEKMMLSFSVHGLPDTLVSDNGSCFTITEFQTFVTENGIKHIKTAPYHPSSNGLAEKAVGIVNAGLEHIKGGTLCSKLSRVLFKYRTTPHTTTGETPAKLLMGRELKTPMDLLRPNLHTKVELQQQKQKIQHDRKAVQRTLSVGDLVYARNHGSGESWLPGIIVSQTGPVSFIVELSRGGLVRKHQDQIRRRFTTDALYRGTPSAPTLKTAEVSLQLPTAYASANMATNASTVDTESPLHEDVPSCETTDGSCPSPEETPKLQVDTSTLREQDSTAVPIPLRRSQRTPRPRVMMDL
jgi:hypothetical protein